MSKTVELQIEKSRNLIEGLRKHLNERPGEGASVDEVNGMVSALNALAVANEECDRLRAELSVKVKNMNEVLRQVKDRFAEKKKMLKGYYPQERWMDYGIPDKR